MPRLRNGGYVGFSTVVDNDTVNKATGVFNIQEQNYWQRLQEWPYKQAAVKATGGNVNALQPGNGYVYHTFTSPGTLSTTEFITGLEILSVGGGGGNNTQISGGGGGGGMLYGSLNVPSGTPFSISLGTGGGNQSNGTNTTITAPGGTFTAYGGGYGGGYAFHLPGPTRYGTPGGCGGGQGGAWPGYPNGQTATSTQTPMASPYGTLTGYGNPGGVGSPGPYSASGGGGTGAAGGSYSPTSNTGGTGGNGRQYTAFTGPLIGVPALAPLNGYYGGGGGGNAYPEVTSGGIGGLGGGGNAYGPASYPTNNAAGVTNSGGGSGGGPYGGYSPLTPGGPGIVIFRYLG